MDCNKRTGETFIAAEFISHGRLKVLSVWTSGLTSGVLLLYMYFMHPAKESTVFHPPLKTIKSVMA